MPARPPAKDPGVNAADPPQTETAAEETVAWLNEVMDLLKTADVTQKRLGDQLGLTPGSITQYLRAGQSDSYPIERVANNEVTVTRIVGAMRALGGDVEHKIPNADRARLSERLSDLTARYPQPDPIDGMGGEAFTRKVANYLPNASIDGWLDGLLADHTSSYAMMTAAQVCGSPGQGKSWALGRLELRARASHIVIRERAEAPAIGQTDLARFARGLREEQRDRYEGALRLARRPVLKASEDVYRRVTEKLEALGKRREDLADHLDVLASEMTDLGDRFGVTRGAIRDLLASKIDGLDRDPVLGDDEKNIAYMHGPATYSITDFAEDLVLLAALEDSYNALAYERGEADRQRLGPRFLILIDGPDRDGDSFEFMQPLRALQQRRGDFPLIDSFMIIVAKTMFGDGRTPVTVSTLRHVRDLEPWDAPTVRDLMRILREHGWFSLSGDDLHNDLERIETDVMRLGGGNRRATCLYLDYLHARKEFVSAEAYLDVASGSSVDSRMTHWLANWARFVAEVERRYANASQIDHELIVGVLEWCTGNRDMLHPAARAHAERFGLLPRAQQAETPLLQQAVRRQIADAWHLLRGREVRARELSGGD